MKVGEFRDNEGTLEFFNGRDWEDLGPVEDPTAKDFDLILQVSDNIFVTCTPHKAIELLTRIYNPRATTEAAQEFLSSIFDVMEKLSINLNPDTGIGIPGEVVLYEDGSGYCYPVEDLRVAISQLVGDSQFLTFQTTDQRLISIARSNVDRIEVRKSLSVKGGDS